MYLLVHIQSIYLESNNASNVVYLFLYATIVNLEIHKLTELQISRWSKIVKLLFFSFLKFIFLVRKEKTPNLSIYLMHYFQTNHFVVICFLIYISYIEC